MQKLSELRLKQSRPRRVHPSSSSTTSRGLATSFEQLDGVGQWSGRRNGGDVAIGKCHRKSAVWRLGIESAAVDSATERRPFEEEDHAMAVLPEGLTQVSDADVGGERLGVGDHDLAHGPWERLLERNPVR